MKPSIKRLIRASLFLFNNKENVSMVIVFILGIKRFIYEDNFIQQLTDVFLVIFYFAVQIFFNIEDE